MELRRLGEFVWELPRQGAMRVAGRIYASEKLMRELHGDPALEQVANMAQLPGIVGYALAMPDIHWGYGFPIGGVAAVDAEEGAISPGGIETEVLAVRPDSGGNGAEQGVHDLLEPPLRVLRAQT